MSENLFTPPEANLVNETEVDSVSNLASRWSRLGASLIDSFIMMLFLMPMMYFFGWFELIANGEQPSFLYTLAFGLLGIIIFIAVNLKFLIGNGQTIGKKLLNIKIVDMDGAKADLQKHLLKRYATYFIPSQVPIVGGIFSFINILFIFRKDKRCVHDLAGGTQVVRS